MGFLKFALLLAAIYLIFFAKKGPARAMGKSVGRFLAGVREGMGEGPTNSSSVRRSVNSQQEDPEILEAQVIRKDTHG